MGQRTKLHATLIQTFGTPILDERIVTLSGDRRDRPTRVGGGDCDDDRLPVEGDIVGGHYRLTARLGAGMFGRVYVAVRTDVPEHRVALKVINRAVYGGRDVERELVMLAAATHPNIVQLKDHGMTADYVWLTMPLYEGETLEERLRRSPLTLREAYEVFVPITRGVHALHERGLRHQDIKPENIFLAQIGGSVHPVLLDLGVAVESGSPFVAGTALYGSPEQIVALGGLDGSAELSEKMDTYCIAATLLRAIVGPDEFPGERASSPFDIATAFETRELSPLTDDVLPGLVGGPRKKLEAAISRWLTRDPAVRPNTGQLADELDVLLEPEREAAAAIEREIAQQKTALKRVRIALVGAAAIGSAVALWGVLHRETLRLARELEHARAAGADSFDKLDTCVAAHRLAQGEATSCVETRDREKQEHEGLVSALTKTHAERATELEADVQRENRRLRSCVDDRKAKGEAWQLEREQLDATVAERDKAIALAQAELTKGVAEVGKLQGELTKRDGELVKLRQEREAASTAKLTCEAELVTLSQTHQQCSETLASCLVDKEALAKASTPPVSASSSGSAKPPESAPRTAAASPDAPLDAGAPRQ